ncbi:MAG: bifunctional phosphoribosylaminoimidazolecarboxamide formyltransferase/IMP cyclohydrolase [Rhodobiaceae bacterium]|jgi:phosphoribosylaminoimidazolecarboxamide formyltransferase/IMP cyclohydrolase|nr:bifunctional phosphoribosylaminoimidazolecarboxamide formyltransferase/IMP cyclohydrolase [Rhodobiaceae bacterium]MBT5518474.1 bifunctional phosphoribosylaminoimidazolecarboxamide formyltransferase/IMP cyclohydrolase [Rhodobiaceae bacterium]
MTHTPSQPDIKPIARALISVSDKEGIVAFAQKLAGHGVELVSTGGTAKLLQDAGLACRDVSELTQFPEMMDGRVKTLHPNVHGGLLAIRDNEQHQAAMAAHNILAIDLLVVNLYPFEATVAAGGDYATCIENIDIGGPAMIRAAAKNHNDVAVLVDNEDYDEVLNALTAGGTDLALRQRLAQKAYARTGAYDAAISNWMAAQLDIDMPPYRAVGGKLQQALRYGENPHQQAGFYVGDTPRLGVATAEQLQGKALSYNNINDTDAAFELVGEFNPAQSAACAIIKHANPCGVATGASLSEAFAKALRCDPVSAFGGIIAMNQPLDAATATAMTEIFTEVIIAPDADAAAREVIAKKKNLRLLITGGLPVADAAGLSIRNVAGGYLVQNRDNGHIDEADLTCVTKRQPSSQEMADLLFAWRVAKHVKSNAIVYVKDGATVGVGAGQMSRLDSSRIAARKSQDAADACGADAPLAQGSVVASDAFFPFADGLLSAAEAGATAVIQPGGSIRDDEVIAAADAAGLAMVFTGMRHFRH